MRIKRNLQRGPKYPKERQNPWPKANHQKTETPPQPGGHHSSPHGPWWQPRSGRAEPHGRGGVFFHPVVRFSSRAFSTSCGFALFCLYISDVSGLQGEPNSLHSHLFSIFIVLERERGSGEELRGFHTGLRSKDGNAFLDELFFPFSFLFSI